MYPRLCNWFAADEDNNCGFACSLDSLEKGLAGTASRYQAEQTQLAGMTTKARNVSFEVLFDAENLEDELGPFLGVSSQ